MNRDGALRDSRKSATTSDLSEVAVRALLSRLMQRDERAMRELHDFYGRRVYLFALTRLRDEQAAETVMIDTLFEVWKHPDRFRGDSRFSTWLLGIAKHKVLNTYRCATPEHDDIADYSDSIPDPQADVAGAYEEQERMKVLMECIERLPPPQHECMQLVFLEGLPLAEVASIQKVPEGTVKTRLHHARRRLRDCVQSRIEGGRS